MSDLLTQLSSVVLHTAPVLYVGSPPVPEHQPEEYGFADASAFGQDFQDELTALAASETPGDSPRFVWFYSYSASYIVPDIWELPAPWIIESFVEGFDANAWTQINLKIYATEQAGLLIQSVPGLVASGVQFPQPLLDLIATNPTGVRQAYCNRLIIESMFDSLPKTNLPDPVSAPVAVPAVYNVAFVRRVEIDAENNKCRWIWGTGFVREPGETPQNLGTLVVESTLDWALEDPDGTAAFAKIVALGNALRIAQNWP